MTDTTDIAVIEIYQYGEWEPVVWIGPDRSDGEIDVVPWVLAGGRVRIRYLFSADALWDEIMQRYVACEELTAEDARTVAGMKQVRMSGYAAKLRKFADAREGKG